MQRKRRQRFIMVTTDEPCRENFALLLAEMGLPDCLLTLVDLEECGYVKDTGFVWLRHKKKREYYKFEDTVISYDAVITAYFQPNKIKNLTGVKAREFLIWINLTEICVEEGDDSPSPSGFFTFKTLAGLSKSFPLSWFGGIRAQALEETDGSKKGNWCKKLKL